MRRASLALVAALTVAVGTAFLPVASGQTPPPTPVPPFGSPSPFPSVLRTPPPTARPPQLSAGSAALIDLDSGRILFDLGAERRRPVASTTKIMTALVVLEATAPRDIVTVGAGAVGQRGSALGLRPGERIPVRELLYALLLQSANDAAIALSEHVAGSVEAFVARMNRRARGLGLEDTRFRSPSGLDDSGFSTALDLAVITREAYRHPVFATIVGSRFRTIPDPGGPPRRIQNRNALLWLYPGAMGAKTGWTGAAGFCLVGAAERGGLRLASVVLGAPLEAFSDSAALLDYGFARFERRTVLEEGRAFGPIVVEGVEVSVGSGASLEALIRRDRDVVLTFEVSPDLSLPLEAGQAVGSVLVRSAGEPLGEVPLVALEPTAREPTRAPPTPRDGATWWEPILDPVAGFFSRVVRSVIP